MDDTFYKPKYCPCCGSKNIEYHIEEEETDEDEWD
jgi:predicted  nucleic acid-binding Zn-ribbon protein